MIRTFLAVLAGKIIRLVCRILRKAGTAAPGRIALKICPDLLSRLSKGVTCVTVTGTNGKTTSVRMIEEGFRQAGLSYFANLTGANLIEGIATDFIVNSTLSGRCRKEYAVLETDEFATKEVCRQLKPKVMLVTNIFVDQVERFGGVKGTLGGIRTGAGNSPSTLLVLNADDCVSSSLASDAGNRAVFYGVGREAALESGYSGSPDVTECVRCGAKLEFGYMTFSHLGDFRCPECGFSRAGEAEYTVKAVTEQTLDRSRIVLSERGEDVPLTINLPAMYNVYNAAGAYAAMREAGIGREAACRALESFRCGFGRMESLPQLGRRGAKMVLVKNGAGCDQVLEFLKKYEEDFTLAIYLNNNVSDGIDVTWLETAAFETLNECRVRRIYVSGMRRSDVHDRLIKAGIPEDRITVEGDCKKLVAALNESEEPVFILPTYTGMMQARSEIVRQCGGAEYWEDQSK